MWRFNLVVHDWGAAALAFAQRAPARVERLVVINALPLFDGYEWHRAARIWRTPLLGRAVDGLDLRRARCAGRCATPTRKPLPESELREIYRGIDFATQRAILQALPQRHARARSPPPASISRRSTRRRSSCGASSTPTSPRAPRRSTRARSAGAVELELLPDAGHWPWLDRPDVIDRVVDFLASRVSGPLGSRLRDVSSHRVNAQTRAAERSALIFCVSSACSPARTCSIGWSRAWSPAHRHGVGVPPRQRRSISLERTLHLFVEPRIQAWAAHSHLLLVIATYVYLNAQTTLIVGALLYLYIVHNRNYYFVRNMLIVAMVIALLCYALYPTAPPRLLPEWGFIDTNNYITGITRRHGRQPTSSTSTPRSRRCTSPSP